MLVGNSGLSFPGSVSFAGEAGGGGQLPSPRKIHYMDVSKNSGTEKWMGFYKGKPGINPWMIWGEFSHYFRKHPYRSIF